ncbi:3-oxoadipate enol-lactonase [Sphingosinicella xenopeptidilytica]|uniref:3-oxoadipate enol-lactonase n=1 Tax=Sphingosinicella xenopeptidilytica TaxID=364098 RepID=A0ABW3C183_SPHXN|nr:3-oxoadipate enol-lactonase [Sphingosinicella sp.]
MTTGIATLGDGCRIAWALDGPEGAPVLMLSNSLGTTMEMWRPQLAAFAARFRILRYDTRGHGRSDAPPGGYGLDRLGRDAVELLDALGIDHVHFCGLSLGGMTGQWLGARAPDRIDRLILANTAAVMGPPSAWDTRIVTVRQQGMAALTDAILERWFTPEFRAVPERTSFVRDQLLATDPAGYAGCCAAIRDMDLRPLLNWIAAPTLVITGSRDPATPPADSALIVEAIPGARQVMLNAAHLSNVEQPEAFSTAVLDFLD